MQHIYPSSIHSAAAIDTNYSHSTQFVGKSFLPLPLFSYRVRSLRVADKYEIQIGLLDEMSPDSGLISVYAPKFDLLNLGKRGERIVLRIIFRSPSLNSTVFANYVVGRKEAQIAIRLLNGLRDIDVVSVTRYGIGEFARDVNRYFKESKEMGFEIATQAKKLELKIGDREISAAAEEI